MSTYHVMVNSQWREVDEYIFRSWTGPRVLDGHAYQGKRYTLGTESEVHSDQRCMEVCCDCGFAIVANNYSDTLLDDVVCPECYSVREQNKRDADEIAEEMRIEAQLARWAEGKL